MAGLTTSTSLQDQLQRHYSRELLMRMLPELVYAEFGLRSPLPAKAGSRSIRLFRFGIPSTSGVITVSTAQEGIPADRSTYRQLNLEYVDADLAQYVQTIAITDVADATGLFDLIGQANMQNAEDAALHCDTLI